MLNEDHRSTWPWGAQDPAWCKLLISLREKLGCTYHTWQHNRCTAISVMSGTTLLEIAARLLLWGGGDTFNFPLFFKNESAVGAVNDLVLLFHQLFLPPPPQRLELSSSIIPEIFKILYPGRQMLAQKPVSGMSVLASCVSSFQFTYCLGSWCDFRMAWKYGGGGGGGLLRFFFVFLNPYFAHSNVVFSKSKINSTPLPFSYSWCSWLCRFRSPFSLQEGRSQ